MWNRLLKVLGRLRQYAPRTGRTYLIIIIGLLIGLQNLTTPKPPVAPAQQPINRPATKFKFERAAPYLPDYTAPTAQNGLAPIIWHIPTSKPVVFLTIDDGVFRPADAASYFEDHRLVGSMFLYYNAIKGHSDYFKGFQTRGSVIENHTLAHPHLLKLTYDQQKTEICGANDQLGAVFGKKPTLFRPPYEVYNTDTLKAVNDCGLKALVLWSVVIDKGQFSYLKNRTALRAGDIVLVHFNHDLAANLAAFEAAADQAGLSVDLLENWVK